MRARVESSTSATYWTADVRRDLELARRAIDALNRRDLETLLALMDAEVESVSRIVAVEGDLHGHEGVRRWWNYWLDAGPKIGVAHE